MTDKEEKSYRSERSSRDKFKKERDDYRRDDRDYYSSSSRRRRERSRSSGLSDHEDDINSNMNMMGMMFNNSWGPGSSRSMQDPNKLDTLVTFKYFSDYYHQKEKNMDDEELSRRYTIYKENFTHKQSQKFFEAHKDEEWFKDKYHPTESLVYREELNKRKEKMYTEFIEKLNQGEYDNVNFDETEKTTETTEDGTEKKEDNENGDTMDTDVDDEEKKNINEGEATKSNRLFIKSIPPNVKRKELIDMCSKFEGFDYLAISDPNPQKKFHRLGWIVFKEGTDIKAAYEKFNNAKIDDFVFHLAYHQTLPARSKTVPEIFSTMDRLKHDLDQAKRLAIALDREVGLDKMDGNGCEALQDKIDEFNNNEEYDEIKKIKKELDLYIEYLHRVHLFCYYNASEAESTEDYDRKCPVLHRQLPKTPVVPASSTENGSPEKEPVETKDKICERIDHKITLRMNRPMNSEDIEKIGGRNVENEIDKCASRNVVKVDEGKYRCKLCSKLFKGESFVKKHIKSKHAESLEPIQEEVAFFNNYAQDIQKITGVFPTSMNQSLMGINMGLGGGSMRLPMPQMMNQGMPWMVPPMVPTMGLGVGMMPMKRGNNYMGGNYYRGSTRGGGISKKSMTSLKRDDKKFIIIIIIIII
ncbi:hypothetical protein PIROE2DRAFT_60926 [Piromyces sp. E2]|nr:hypothetical protein PIROE2DRAFT_60926 [Piromyces sp. E2]|eukprot:OUM64059.1 hypothetical protein PIROE2DRAFT_60926 [Piromyces sp. E2]